MLEFAREALCLAEVCLQSEFSPVEVRAFIFFNGTNGGVPEEEQLITSGGGRFEPLPIAEAWVPERENVLAELSSDRL